MILKLRFAFTLSTALAFSISGFTSPLHDALKRQAAEGKETAKKSTEKKEEAKEDLFCVSQGVADAGYLVLGYLQKDGSLLTEIRPVTFAGSGTVLFKGILKIFKAKDNDGNKTFELRDHRTEANTTIRLIENGQDSLVLVNGIDFSSNQISFSNLGCTISDGLGEKLK
ncbi:hypothetical protein GW915_09650 [bacterium]|nr:hypothetical protein [bacterium]